MYLCIGNDELILVNVDSVDFPKVPLRFPLQNIRRIIVSSTDSVLFSVLLKTPLEVYHRYLHHHLHLHLHIANAISNSWRMARVASSMPDLVLVAVKMP